MKEISFMDFPQHGEVFYFYCQTLDTNNLHCVNYNTEPTTQAQSGLVG
jgi:hypothetical protein